MKVLHLIDSGGLYGAEKAMLALAEEQQRRGMSVAIGSIGVPGAQKHVEFKAVAQGIGVVRIEMASGINLRNVRGLGQILQPQRCDVVHTHGYKPNVLMALQPRRQQACTHVVTLHGWTSYGKWTRNAFYEALDRRMLVAADAVAIVSESMRGKLPAAVHGRVQTVANGLPLTAESSSADLRDVAEFCARSPTVVCVGRLSPEKDQSTILHALAMEGGNPSLQALFLGDGPLRPNLERLTQSLGLTDRVFFAGYVEDAWRTFSDCVALVISSITEGLPMALLEAMRARLPIISTPVGEIPATTDGSGGAWLFPVGDRRALAKVMADVVVSRDDSAARAEHSYQRFVESFSIGRTADRYESLYATAQPADRRRIP